MSPAKSAKPRPPFSWTAAGAVVLICASAGGIAAWAMSMREIDRQIDQTQDGLKRLHLTGRVPPNQEVLGYLEARTSALTAQYQAGLRLVAPAMSELGAGDAANPQLHFQERVHEVQRILERLAAARGMEVPLQLGFPKELPPADAVPQLLVQLDLVQDAAELIVPQAISKLASVKLEDPQAASRASEKDPFLTRLPVRLRITCTLETLTKLLGLVDRMEPLTEFQALRMRSVASEGPVAATPSEAEQTSALGAAGQTGEGASSAATPSAQSMEEKPSDGPEELEVDLVLARYLAFSTDIDESRLESSAAPSSGLPQKRRSKSRAARSSSGGEDR